MSIHHYAIAQKSADSAIEQAAKEGWSETDVLQSLIVIAIERYRKVAGYEDARAILDFEAQNLANTIDFDFVRSR